MSRRMGFAFDEMRGRMAVGQDEEQGARMDCLRGVAAGLVSVSTTCKEGEFKNFSELLGEAETVEIDKNIARITRLRKSLGVAAKCLHNLGARNQRIWMQTLTYRGDNDAWRAEHISRYLDGLRKWHYSRTGSKKVRYVWCAELQKRGVIHYHVILWLDHALTPPMADRPWKNRGRWEPPMWRHGMSNRLESFAPVAYIMNYAKKIEQKNIGNFPRGARIHGCGGLDVTGRGIRRWVMWPAYVQGNAEVGERWRPAKGGGYENASTGEILLAEFAPTGSSFTRFVRVRRHPRAIDAAGPFNWFNPLDADASMRPVIH
ncbi:hypothetical protein [Comamonas sp. NoAH]|uniref:rolling circle replication-associated protein n=1 Tax=Comamonas halotolerans TaxID=3041496 RepID=UPI0024E0BFF5|nr:hypothetical protein [Comamonas sp. NoAH]